MPLPRDKLRLAVGEILRRHGEAGRPLSYRQAERRTGLSPATVGELAAGVARTRQTVVKFAQGLGEDANRLLALAGFMPDDAQAIVEQVVGGSESDRDAAAEDRLFPEERAWLGRFGRSLAQLPPGRERDLWRERLRQDAELLEAFLARLAREETREARGTGEEPTKD